MDERQNFLLLSLLEVVPLVQNLLYECKFWDQELVWFCVQVCQIHFLAELIAVNITTFVLIQVVYELSGLILGVEHS